jgi:hypothetical protein
MFSFFSKSKESNKIKLRTPKIKKRKKIPVPKLIIPKEKRSKNPKDQESKKKEEQNKKEEIKKEEEIKNEEEIKKEEEIKIENPKLKGDLEKIIGTIICHSPISLYDHDQKKLQLKKEDLIPENLYNKFYTKYIKNFEFPKEKDDYRPSYANNQYGGMDFPDEKTASLLRGMGWDLIKDIGKKILSGNFNLTQVSIPIRVMIPITILQHVCNGHFNYPLYLNLASLTNDYVERMKFIIVATLSCWFKSSVVLKPLNPILGETYEMIWEDGSHEYVEQTSHHPPCSNFIIYGPNNNYIYCGYLNYTSNAWINSFKLKNTGKRYIKFKDGTHVDFNFSLDNYSNTFWGCFRHEIIGQMEFNDITNGINCKFNLGSDTNKKLSDYFIGEIKDKDGNVVSKFNGSYLSHIDFDGIRYWDIRKNIDIEAYPIKNQLPSSSIYRIDSQLLYERKIDEAQEEKIRLEELQRHDRKLRKEFMEKNNIQEDIKK